MKRREELNGGFTLIELVVVMAIIAILATLVIGAIVVARQTTTRTVHNSNAKTIQTALEADFTKHPTTGYMTLAAGTTFTAASAAAVLGDGTNPLRLSTTTCPSGGGTIQSGPTGYTITPVDFNCATTLPVITGP